MMDTSRRRNRVRNAVDRAINTPSLYTSSPAIPTGIGASWEHDRDHDLNRGRGGSVFSQVLSTPRDLCYFADVVLVGKLCM